MDPTALEEARREAQDIADVEAVQLIISNLTEAYLDAMSRMQMASTMLTNAVDAVDGERAWDIPGLPVDAVERLSGWSGWGRDVEK